MDSFGDLRDQLKENTEEMMNVCMICNDPRQYFDRLGEGFDNHVKGVHNVSDLCLTQTDSETVLGTLRLAP